MSKSRNILSIFVVGALLIAVVATSAMTLLYLREAEHNDFHRSMAAQSAMLADLRFVYPPGTPQSVVLDDFDLGPEDLAMTEFGPTVAIKPPLRLEGDAREYRGFVFLFVDDTVAQIDRIGPDGPGRAVSGEKFFKRLEDYRRGGSTE